MQDSATTASPFTEAGFRRVAARALYAELPPARPGPEPLGGPVPAPSDFDLNPDAHAWLTDEPPRPAAVLVPVVARLP